MSTDHSTLPAAWESRDESHLLRAVRLAGFADTEAVADRCDRPASVVGDALRGLEGRRLIERMTFADAGGWILTEAGKARDLSLVQEELAVSGARSVLQATADVFESTVNHRLVRTITEWQLRPPTGQEDGTEEVLRRLTDVAETLRDLMADLVDALPRFGRYPRQFSAALAKAREGDDQWVAGVGRLSCHVVWAELHEDLLSSLGRGRSAEPRGGR
ncbi:hypothetical protein J4H86_18950 [Spiractinospora alimapuensis]|uniref:hypothetical protein n=1 Tax=Spiractinospora alimapuensis TaxID=2820884 RepID=UPI001F1B71EE|nr:hypothetical protein [Spiractinospora alimapuensis]QVQ50922.1 hypothetical protein J4H86_18950 [Spiractinospora alimapuensis]